MKFLLLGKGKTILAIKKYLKAKNVDYIHAVFKEQYIKKYQLIDDNLLKLEDIDYAIKSPGISEKNQMYLKLSLKFTFISELDLLDIFKENIKCIVVTGSNGKTTFVSMLHYLLKKANLKTLLCGNSFEPITSYYKSFKKYDYLIVEQSSFQLHDLKYYKPYIAIILNLQNNHLDSSFSLNSYFTNKRNIFKYQDKNCYFIYDENVLDYNNLKTNANIIDLLKYDKISTINDNLKKFSKSLDYFYTIFKILLLDTSLICNINNFKTLKYRFEVFKYNDITFINDAKSTSVEATLFALNNIIDTKKCILIIGGKDKNHSFAKLNDIKIPYIICYGQIANNIKKEIKNCLICNDLKSAFQIACFLKLDNKIILFSPATSSFDQFKSFNERGKLFNNLMKKYEKRKH